MGSFSWCVCASSITKSCWTHCNLMDSGPPGSSVHRTFQARILEWIATSFSRGSTRPRDWIHVSCFSYIGRWILYPWVTWETLFSCSMWDLVPWPLMEPGPLALVLWSLSHWTTREVPGLTFRSDISWRPEMENSKTKGLHLVLCHTLKLRWLLKT